MRNAIKSIGQVIPEHVNKPREITLSITCQKDALIRLGRTISIMSRSTVLTRAQGIEMGGFDIADQKLINLVIGECGLSRIEAERIVVEMTNKEKEQGLEGPSFLQELVEQIYERVRVRLEKEENRRNSF